MLTPKPNNNNNQSILVTREPHKRRNDRILTKQVEFDALVLFMKVCVVLFDRLVA